MDFQEFISQPGRLNVVDFHADWCGPCKKLGPELSAVITPSQDLAARIKEGMDDSASNGETGTPAVIPDRPRPSNAKPIEEAVKPVSNDWLPPGMSRKK